MNRQNSQEIYYVSLSKLKILGFTVICWIFALLFFFLFVLMLKDGFKKGDPLDFNSLFAPAVLFVLFLPFALGPIIPILLLRKPIAILNSQGFTGVKVLRHESFPWTPDTVLYSIKGRLILANPDKSQSRLSKLWRGHKNAVAVSLIFGKQKHRDILKAIYRLSPYKIENVDFFGL